jgi:mycothiol system anti-sigma-R factor
MNCKRVEETMFLVTDNELDEDVLVVFRRHLELCPHCARRFEVVSRFLALVRERCCRRAAPDRLRIRILASLPHRRIVARPLTGGPDA